MALGRKPSMIARLMRVTLASLSGKKQALDLGRLGLRNLPLLRTICVFQKEKKRKSTEKEFNKRRYTPKSSCDVIYFVNVVIKMQIEKGI